MQNYTFNRDKFKRLVRYVIHLAGSKPGFGATKVYKVLWFVEAKGAILRGKPVTGAKFVRRQHGPVPAQAMPVRSELEREGLIKVTKDWHYNREIMVFKSLKQPDMSDFDAEELRDIKYWVSHIAEEHTAESISEATHNYGWLIANQGEDLPYLAILSERVRPLNAVEMEWATRRAAELNAL